MLLILSKVWKYLSGWINYSDKVISQKASENLREYRGSKSIIDLLANPKKSMVVKEQRVDGSWCNNAVTLLRLRCILMGFERDYQIRNPSKELYKKRD